MGVQKQPVLCMHALSKGALTTKAVLQVGISVNLIFLVVGLVVSSAVPPLAFLLTWSKVPSGAAITGALAGQAAGIIAWLVHTQIVYGAITQDTAQVEL